jgi:hypothetical protein
VYAPKFELRSFDVLPAAAKEKALYAMLEALVAANEAYLTAHPTTPTLYASGVVYAEEPPGRDHWQDIPRTLELREGDCEDLACWRIAELRVKESEYARPLVRHQVIGSTVLYHVAVLRADGQVEDPAKTLGMSG